jgi:glycogen(starch) synthase
MEHMRPVQYEKFIFISEETRNKFPIKKDSYAQIIPNGVSPELLDLLPVESDYILYLGRIDVYGKGIDLLIRAYEDCCKSFPHLKLVIAGDGRDKDRKSFKELMDQLPKAVSANIEVCGWVSGKKKEEVLRNALFVVCPSRHEVQPITTLEAMASGKAVLVSDIPAFSFVTERQAGMSFENGSAVSLSQSMKILMSSDERREMGQRGRAWVQGYTWDKIALRFEEFLLRFAGSS